MFIASLKITDKSVFAKAAEDYINKNAKFKSGKTSAEVQASISALIHKALMDSDTVKELLSGKLRHDFGLYGNLVETTMSSIITYISSNINLDVEKSTGKNASKINIKLMPGDFSKIISTSGGSFKSSGGKVDWLEWLLTRGTQVVVADFWLFTHARGTTRSGGSEVMVKISKKKRDPFRVDPQHAGTVDDNFITRALETVYDDIAKIVAESYVIGSS